jgi:hypothetical protein
MVMETILLLMTAAAACLSAVGAFEAARSTKRATELSLLKSFMDEYKSEEMTRHMKKLREISDWWKANTSYGISMKVYMERPYSEPIEQTRRTVKFYYFTIHDLYETKNLKKRIYLKAMKNAGLTLFFEVVEPLDYWNSKRTGEPFEEKKYRLIEKTTGYGKRDSVWYREKAEAMS